MTALHVGSLCTGYGGLELAVREVFNSEPRWFAEVDPAALRVLEHHWPRVPNLGDIRAVDWTSVPRVDLLTAGYPCQPFSVAGQRKGADDPRHLWPHVAEAVRAARPGIVVLENVAGHRSKGFGAVLADLAALGYRAAWGSLRASDVGAPHARDRVCIVATHPGHGPVTERARAARRPVGERSPVRQEPAGGREVPPGVDWREFRPYVARWAEVVGRPAPKPWVVTSRSSVFPSAVFAEWVMGLPHGHVSAVPGLSMDDQMRLIGNGVVPRQLASLVRALFGALHP